MKFNILIALFGLVAAEHQDFEKEETLSEKWGKVMDDFSNFGPNTWDAVKHTAKKIPARRMDNRMRD